MRKFVAFAVSASVALGVGGIGSAQPAQGPPADEGGGWVNNLDSNGWVAPALSADGRTVTLRRPPEHRPDGLVVMWERYEHRDREAGQWRSLVAMSEFDCQEGRARTLQETTYSEPNLSGRAVTASMPGDWTYPIPGSMMEGSMRIACQTATASNKARAARAASAERARTAAEAAAPAAAKTVKAAPATRKKASATTKTAATTKASATTTKAAATKKKAPAKPRKPKAPPPEPAPKHVDIPLPPSETPTPPSL